MEAKFELPEPTDPDQVPPDEGDAGAAGLSKEVEDE